MGLMTLTYAFDIAFAAGIVVAAFALTGAALRFLPSAALVALASLELAGGACAWLVFALRRPHVRELAVAAGGLTGCLLAAAAAVGLRRTLVRADAIDAHLQEAKDQLLALVD